MKYAITLNILIIVAILAVIFWLNNPLGLLGLCLLQEMPYGLLTTEEKAPAQGQMMSYIDTNDMEFDDEQQDKAEKAKQARYRPR